MAEQLWKGRFSKAVDSRVNDFNSSIRFDQRMIAVASPSVQTLILGMSITGWIAMARFIRNQILIIRDRDYNVASRCIGTPTSRIVVRNLLPYLVSVIMLRMALTIPAAIGSEVFITYIGLGLSVEVPSLGNLINDGRKVMMQAGLRYQLLYPTIILSFVTIAFYLIGNAFSDAADPKPWKKMPTAVPMAKYC